MDVDSFLAVGETLIDQVFPTPLVYHQHIDGTSGYDPLSGVIPSSQVDHSINAGVLSRSRTEEGGVGESYTIQIWVHHGATGLQFLPKTSDSFTYDGTVWRVTSIEPTYSSDNLIASKITGRSD